VTPPPTARTGRAGPEDRASARLERTSHACAGIAIGLGVLVLLGWLAGIEVLTSVLPDRSNMKANTAVGLVLSGTGLALALPARRPRSMAVARVAAVAVVAIGALTLLQYRTGWDLGIDELLAEETTPPPGSVEPGRMAESTALALVMLGTALFALDVRLARRWHPTPVLAATVAAVGYLAALGHAYGVSSLYSFAAPTQMALNTSLALLVLAVGVVCARPTPTLLALLTSPGPSGVLVRRVVPAAFVVLTALGALTLAGTRVDLFDPEFGVSLLVVGSIAAVCTLVLAAAEYLRHSEARRREAEAASRLESLRLQAIVDQLPAGVHVKGLDGRFQLVNQRIERFLAMAKDDIVGRTLHDLLAPALAEALEEFDRHVLEVMEPVEVEETVTVAGEERTFLNLRFPLVDGDGRALGVAGVSTELTARVRAQQERRLLEARLAETERLEALGRLAGGVAHDFNNLLTVVLNCATFLAPVVAGDDEAREDVERIERAARRGAELTRSLLAFSRREPVSPVVVDLNDLVGETCELLERTLGDDIELRPVLEPDLWPVTADPGAISQVLMNLAVNARHAMPSGGRLQVATANVDLDGSTAAFLEMPPGRYARVTVADTGVGMTPEVRARAFDPFFTTRPTGSGTGLGLASAHGAVRQAGGQIRLYSEPGVGTTVRVYLPATEGAAAAAPAPAAADGRALAGTTALVVEDEAEVRDLAVRLLEEAGVRVVAAEQAVEALEAVAAEEALDLLITDVVMPGMSGPELARRAQALRAGLPVLFVSGYPEGVLSHGGRLDAQVHLLEKPFSAAELHAAVRAALAG
jgi:two-component system, cell cycle sensor histidine kinase and response regulator CckA